ncbi:MAG: NUDIX domain-containing protein [Actinomycetota bacterium]|nr:NUDIX domain-containing protein [Actinomycetota bacterium]
MAAAVCYRWAAGNPEFLLVRTKASTWNFPGGGIEPGETTWQAAAREAFEEAGVTGKVIEQALGAFPDRQDNQDGTQSTIEVIGHLLEVQNEQAPSEPWRTPQWFTPEAAKIELAADRHALYAWPLTDLIEEALSTLSGESHAK